MPILTYEEYSKINHPTPYFYKIKSGDSFLYYFGEGHSFDPQNKQWETMKGFWAEFLKDTENKKRIVFIESGNLKPKDTEEQTIIEMGGGGLATFLAFQNGISTFCPEPDFKEQFAGLEKQFSHEEVAYYYFARTVSQWHRKNPKPDFEVYMKYFLKRNKKESGWEDINFSVGGMIKIHGNIFGTQFDQNDEKFFREISSPVELKTVINKVNRALTNFRDEYIVEKIKEYVKNDYSIFSEYGSGHTIVQEPLLREIL
jgi:hypothetical protein